MSLFNSLLRKNQLCSSRTSFIQTWDISCLTSEHSLMSLHCSPSGVRVYPSAHSHTKEPSVLRHRPLTHRPTLIRHSFTSVKVKHTPGAACISLCRIRIILFIHTWLPSSIRHSWWHCGFSFWLRELPDGFLFSKVFHKKYLTPLCLTFRPEWSENIAEVLKGFDE